MHDRADWYSGEMLGLPVPAHAAALRDGGVGWLTDAFRAAGALGYDNRVAAITRFEERLGGGTGRKLLLSVDYERPDPALPADLFVKFSRDYDDDFRDSLKSQMAPEVQLALLSRAPDFPATVARCMYADLHAPSGTGVLITERIGFGEGGIEPAYEKCRDHELPEPLAHYRALLTAVARLAGGHKAGRMPAIARYFPFAPERIAFMAPIPYSAEQLQRRVERYAAFAARHPQLLPEHIRTSDFLAGLSAAIPRVLAHEAAIKAFLHGDPRLIALCHWNANVDNGWFWRDADGELACGLLDWGGVGQMSVALALYGALSGAEPELWDAHLDELLATFAAEYRRSGGPEVTAGELKLHLQLMTAIMGLAWLLDAPAVIQKEIPDLGTAESRFDPRFRSNETARMRLHMITMFLHQWAKQDLGAVLERFLRDQRLAAPVAAS
ncbi:hypothetical protein LJR219_000461 [Phenylobacterium sp. LjRoot219]|uniref:hypothetical protein n=1 Tax=Phenylobacterium sp. LjRoot219 TaxID=3342283 RepID=UPI003ED0FC31